MTRFFVSRIDGMHDKIICHCSFVILSPMNAMCDKNHVIDWFVTVKAGDVDADEMVTWMLTSLLTWLLTWILTRGC